MPSRSGLAASFWGLSPFPPGWNPGHTIPGWPGGHQTCQEWTQLSAWPRAVPHPSPTVLPSSCCRLQGRNEDGQAKGGGEGTNCHSRTATRLQFTLERTVVQEQTSPSVTVMSSCPRGESVMGAILFQALFHFALGVFTLCKAPRGKAQALPSFQRPWGSLAGHSLGPLPAGCGGSTLNHLRCYPQSLYHPRWSGVPE